MNILWFHCTYIKPSWKIAFYILGRNTQNEILSLLYAQCNISREYKTVLWLPLMSVKAKLNYAIKFRIKSWQKWLTSFRPLQSVCICSIRVYGRSPRSNSSREPENDNRNFTLQFPTITELPLSCIIFRSIHPTNVIILL